MDERARRIERLFQQALDLPEDERSVFLAGRGSGDEVAEVLELLRHESRVPRGFLSGAGGAIVPGERLGPYEIVALLGEGGMGTVFRARQTTPIRRTVALKVVRPGMDTADVVTRFEAERQALAMMEHRSIARVLDGGATPDGRPFFVMELVSGEPITEYVRLRSPDLASRLALFAEVCRAVQHAHHKGVVHRDLKPSNVLVADGEDGPVVKVIDFGIAKAFAGSLTENALVTGRHRLLGTPAYMSPEQVSGADVDARTDVYSLGVLLYELLTGGPPLDPTELARLPIEEVCRLVREEEAPLASVRLERTGPLHASDATPRALRGDLDTIAAKALAKGSERRYPSAADLAGDVERWLAGEPIDARRDSTLYVLRKRIARHRIAVSAIAAIALVLAVSSIVAWTLYHEARDQLRDSLLAQARVRRQSVEAGRRFESLDLLARAAAIRPGLDLRSEAAKCLPLVDLRVERVLERGEPWVYGRPDPTLATYVVHDAAGNLHLRRTEDGTELARFPAQREPILYVGASPGGRLVAAQYGVDVATTLLLWDPERAGGPAASFPDAPRAGYEFSADGSTLAVGLTDGTLRLLRTDDLEELERWEVGGGGLVPVDFSSSGRLAGLTADGRRIELRRVPGGALEHSLELPCPVIHAIGVHPTGDPVVFRCEGGTSRFWSPSTGEVRAVPELDAINPYFFRFDPVGGLLFTAGWMHTTAVWDADATRSHVRLPGHAWFVGPDGRRVGYMHHSAGEHFRELGLWALATGPECRTFETSGRHYASSASADPQGRLVALVGWGGVWLGNPWTGTLLATLPPASAAVFTRGGSAIVTAGTEGVWRWPIDRRSEGPWRVGPPELLDPTSSLFACVVTEVGGSEVLFVGRERESVERIDLEHPGRRTTFSLLRGGLGSLAADPGGRFLAASPFVDSANRNIHPEPGIRVWDARTGEQLAQLLPEGVFQLEFSRTGDHLLASNKDEVRVWRTGEWEEALHMVRSVDASDVAARSGRTLVLDPSTLEPVLALEFPARWRTAYFLPEGRFLATPVENRTAVLVWNLPRVRRTLGSIGLDWGSPDAGRTGVDDPAPPRLSGIEVDLGSLDD